MKPYLLLSGVGRHARGLGADAWVCIPVIDLQLQFQPRVQVATEPLYPPASQGLGKEAPLLFHMDVLGWREDPG